MGKKDIGCITMGQHVAFMHIGEMEATLVRLSETQDGGFHW